MPLETASYINQLDAANPLGSDPIASGDDHIRLVKSAVKATFPNITGPVTLNQDQINVLPTEVNAVGASVASLSSSTTTAIATKADKTITITATGGLTGGGDLTASRTVSIADGGVSAAKIADGSISTIKLVNASVDSSKLANGSVTNEKLVNSVITPEKLSGGQSGAAPIYGVRAWGYFNSASILASGNISSITYASNAYTVNFTTAMPDANYAVTGSYGDDTGDIYVRAFVIISKTASSFTFAIASGATSSRISVMVVR